MLHREKKALMCDRGFFFFFFPVLFCFRGGCERRGLFVLWVWVFFFFFFFFDMLNSMSERAFKGENSQFLNGPEFHLSSASQKHLFTTSLSSPLLMHNVVKATYFPFRKADFSSRLQKQSQNRVSRERVVLPSH